MSELQSSGVVSMRKVQETITTIQENLGPVTYAPTTQILQTISNRVDNISTLRIEESQGIAAGDMGNDFMHGIWMKGIVSAIKYKALKEKLNILNTGGVVGYDLKINDEILLGAAFG